MQLIEPEYAEFWSDYKDALVEEFLIAQSVYSASLKAERLTNDIYSLREEFVAGESFLSSIRRPSRPPTEEMARVATVDREVQDSRLRFKRAVELLQNCTVQKCRWVIDQINLIQENNPDCDLDISILVRHFAVGIGASLAPTDQRPKSWFQILLPNPTSRN